METYEENEYKTTSRRLMFQWHPDKNPGEEKLSNTFFRTINRHAMSFKSDRKFSWLEKETFDSVDTGSSEQSSSQNNQESFGPSWNWDDEKNAMADDIQREESAVQEAKRQAHVTNVHKAKSTFHEAKREAHVSNVHDAKRDFSFKMANNMWECANIEIQTSEVLCDKLLFPGSVWHAQQAVEMMIKSLMFRTCGITQFELKGKGAHNLLNLLKNIESNEENWPVSKEDLMWLSTAYFDARYPMSTLPWEIYCCDKSKQAREINKKMKKWVIMKTSVSMPDPVQLEVISTRDIESESMQILPHPVLIRRSERKRPSFHVSSVASIAERKRSRTSSRKNRRKN